MPVPQGVITSTQTWELQQQQQQQQQQQPVAETQEEKNED